MSTQTLTVGEKVQYPVTPDGRYFIVRGRLWRCADPALSPDQLKLLVSRLMRARSRMRSKTLDVQERARLRAEVEATKRGLGERGPVWWTDGAPDLNRRLVRNTPYAQWFEALGQHA